MKKIKILSLLLAFSMLAAFMAACGDSSSSGSGTSGTTGTVSGSSTAQTTGGGEGEPQSGGTLKIAINRAIKAQGVDPFFSDSVSCEFVIQNYLDTLVLEDPVKATYYPNLAKSWEVSDDGMTWTFHLRDDVHFHPGTYQDGRLMTAADVEYTYDRMLNNWNKVTPSVESVEVIDDFTVAYHLVAPDAIFLNTIVNTSMGVICKEEVEGWGDEEYWDHVVGTGPYIITDHEAEVSTKAVRNENYWGDVKPYVEAVEWVIITDPTQAMNALQSGEIDLNAYVVGDGLVTVTQDPNLSLVQGPENRIALFTFNTENPKLSDVRVRKALTHAVDYAQLASTMRNGEGGPNQLPVPQTNWGWNQAIADSVPKYDVEAAKALLVEAGVTDLELTVNYVEDEARTRAVTMVQQFWDAIGVTVIARPVSQAELTDLYVNGTNEVVASSQGGTGDPATFPGYFLSTGRIGTNFNAYRYSDPESDQLIADALATTDQAERKAIYDQLIQTYVDECLGICYGTVNISWGVNNRVHGLVQDGKAWPRLTGVPEMNCNVWLDQA